MAPTRLRGVRKEGKREPRTPADGGAGVAQRLLRDNRLARPVARQRVTPWVATKDAGQQLDAQATSVAACPVDV